MAPGCVMSDATPAVRHDAIIVCGGRGSRLGAGTKPHVTVAGSRLIDTAMAAVAGAGQVCVVGDVVQVPATDRVIVTNEEPRFGGPAAALAHGTRTLCGTTSTPAPQVGEPATWVVVLAADLPGAATGVPILLTTTTHVCADVDAVAFTDDTHRVQWLFACYRTEALQRAVAHCPDATNVSMRRLVGAMNFVTIPGPWHITGDVDTPHDLATWQEHHKN